jgi:RNA polymerase sigma-70 factor (ECF subfamily)
MLSNLQISQTLNKKEGLMNTFRRTVSAEAMQFEWAEIQAAQQNPALFRPLYERYFEPIFQFIYNRTVNEDLTSDLCSQVFLKALQRLGEYSFRGVPFSAWLFRIASNEVAQYYRQSQKRRVVAIEESHLGGMLEEMDSFDFEKYRSALLQSLDQLREHDLEIVEMRFFEQRPFKEIAEFLEITESNAKVRTYRVLDKLKKLMLEKLPDDQ